MSKTETLSGAQLVSLTLLRYGTRTVFSVGGGSHARLLAAMDDDGWSIVSNRHEAGAVLGADGYSRVTGRLGVAVVIADQGLPNAITGIATAFHANSPVLVLVARLPVSWDEAKSESDLDRHALVDSITKDARTVPSASRLAEYVDAAARRCLTGRCGPVVLVVPMEYFSGQIPIPATVDIAPISVARPEPDRPSIEAAALALAHARRPLVIVGAGACRSDAGEALLELSSQHHMPVVGNGLGRGLVPEDGERGFSWPYAQIEAHQADVVLLVGARLKQRLNYGLPPRFAKDSTFIQIDIEPAEFHRNRATDIPVHADADKAIKAINEKLSALEIPMSRGEWLAEALTARAARLSELQAIDKEPMHPAALAKAIADVLPDDVALIGDGADVQNWLYGAVRIQQAPGFFDHYPLGSMGVGTPLAVGVAAGLKEDEQTRAAVLVTGDGSIGFYPAELHAAMAAGLSLPVVVANDQAWGTEMHGQKKMLGRAVNTRLGDQHYEKLAEVFGGQGVRVTTAAQLRRALADALQTPGVTVINALTDADDGALLKEDRLVSTILFDDVSDVR